MAGPNMKRDESLAGKSVKQGGYTVTYNDRGYATRATKDGGKSATSTVKTTHANDSATHQKAYQAAQGGDWDAVGNAINEIAFAGGKDEYGNYDMGAANQYMRELQNEFLYNANDYYRGKYDSVYGEGAWDGGTGTGQPVYNDYSQNLLYQAALGAVGGEAAADPYTGTNYHQDAINAAKRGDWASVLAALRKRDEKTMNTGENYGKASSDIYQELLKQYGGDRTTTTNGFTFEDAPEYYDDYRVKIDSALDRVLNRDPFSYNPEEDAAYQALRDMYAREGDRAMRDTLGEVSARTGGLASTYAVTAAQQANQYYMQQLADRIPELQQLAYQMYMDDINLQVQDLGLLQSASSDAYNRYRDTVSDWNNNRNFAYGSYRDDIADTQWQTQFDYNAERDSIADSRYDTEWEYQLSRDELADQRYASEWAYQVAQDQRAAAQAAARSSGGSGGSGGSSYSDEVTAVAAFLGLSEKEANALKNVGATSYTEALRELGIGGGSSGNAGGSGGSKNSSSEPEVDTDSVYALGYGPISSEELARLVKSGEVEMYVEGGKTKFRKKSTGGGNGFNSLYSLAY